jgi:hypothetical protein
LTSDDERSENSSNFRENSALTVTEARVAGVGYMGPRYHIPLGGLAYALRGQLGAWPLAMRAHCRAM